MSAYFRLREGCFEVGFVARELFVLGCQELGLSATVEPHDVGEVLALLRAEPSVGSVDLLERMSSVNEEDFVLAFGARFSFVKKPKRAGERYRVEEVRTDRDHHINRIRLEQLFANLHL